MNWREGGFLTGTVKSFGFQLETPTVGPGPEDADNRLAPTNPQQIYLNISF